MPKRSHFGLREKSERERERGERKENMSSTISRGFAGRNSAGRELKMLYAMKSYAWVLESQDFSKVQGSIFHGNQKKGNVSGNQAN